MKLLHLNVQYHWIKDEKWLSEVFVELFQKFLAFDKILTEAFAEIYRNVFKSQRFPACCKMYLPRFSNKDEAWC